MGTSLVGWTGHREARHRRGKRKGRVDAVRRQVEKDLRGHPELP